MLSVIFGNGTTRTAIGSGLTNTNIVQVKAFIFRDEDLLRTLFAHADFTEKDCTITIDKKGCTIIHTPTGGVVNFTPKTADSRLWPFEIDSDHSAHSNFVSRNQIDADRVMEAYEAFGCPPLSSFYRAVKDNYFSWPGLTAKMIYDNVPIKPATAIGHLDRNRKGKGSTKKKNSHQHLLSDITHPVYDSDDSHDCFFTFIQPSESGLFADATGRFSFSTLSNTKLILIWTYNGYVDYIPLQDDSLPSVTLAYETIIALLNSKGHFPPFIRFDLSGTQAHPTIRALFNDANIKVEYCPPGPGGHRTNKAEGAIRHVINHFTSILSNCHTDFPMAIVDKLFPQTFLTYQLVCPWGPDRTISAYEGFHNNRYDLLRHPLKKPGGLILIFEDPAERASLAPHGVRGFMLGPFLQGYRMWNCWAAATSALRVTDTISILDQPFLLDGADSTTLVYDAIHKAAHEISSLRATLAQHSSHVPEILQLSETAAEIQSLHHILDTHLSTHHDTLLPTSSVTETPSNQRVGTPSNQRVVVPTTPEPRKRRSKHSWSQVPEATVRRLNQQGYLSFINRTFSDEGSTWRIINIDRDGNNPILFYRYVDIDDPSIVEHTPCNEMINITHTPPSVRASWVHLCPDFPLVPTTPKINPVQQVVESPPSRADRAERRARLSTAKVHFAAADSDSMPSLTDRSNTESDMSDNESDHNNFLFAASVSYDAVGSAPLNLNPDGTAKTYRSVMNGPDAEKWIQANDTEWRKLFKETIKPIHPREQDPSRRKDTTYVSSRVKEKYDAAGNIKARVRNTLGGDRINFTGETSSGVASDSLNMCILQSVLGRRKLGFNQRFCTIDVDDFYLHGLLPRPEFMRVDAARFSTAIRNEFNLHEFIHDDKILFQADGNIWGHNAAGLVAHNDFVAHMLLDNWIENKDVEGLFTKIGSEVKFSQTVDDSGVSYNADKPHELEALLAHMRKKYAIKVNMLGNKFLGMTLDWNYEDNYFDRSIPTHWPETIARFAPDGNLSGARSPGHYEAFTPGAGSTIPFEDTTPTLDASGKLYVQQFTGKNLFYATHGDWLLQPYVRAISDHQSQASERDRRACDRLLSYGHTHRNAVQRYYATDMIARASSDASHQSLDHSGSVVASYIHLVNRDSDDTFVNSPTATICRRSRTVCSAASETEYASLYETGCALMPVRTILAALDFPQETTTIYTDNLIAKNICARLVRPKRSKAIDMRYHWIRDRVDDKYFDVVWLPSTSKSIMCVDALTKIHPVKKHEELVSLFMTYK